MAGGAACRGAESWRQSLGKCVAGSRDADPERSVALLDVTDVGLEPRHVPWAAALTVPAIVWHNRAARRSGVVAGREAGDEGYGTLDRQVCVAPARSGSEPMTQTLLRLYRAATAATRDAMKR